MTKEQTIRYLKAIGIFLAKNILNEKDKTLQQDLLKSLEIATRCVERTDLDSFRNLQ